MSSTINRTRLVSEMARETYRVIGYWNEVRVAELIDTRQQWANAWDRFGNTSEKQRRLLNDIKKAFRERLSIG